MRLKNGNRVTQSQGRMRQPERDARVGPASAPIKLPNPPDEQQAETPKVGCRDAPGG
jgi:hypothetical protein